jgi:hypothetical protein
MKKSVPTHIILPPKPKSCITIFLVVGLNIEVFLCNFRNRGGGIMDTVAGGGYSLEDLREATDTYVARRTKTWLGVCWYKPDITLYLEWDDETLYQVGEVLSCSKAEAECVLKLLKSSGVHFTFTTYTYEEPKNDEDDDEEEEFDENGWMTDSGYKNRENRFLSWHTYTVGKSYRYLGVLSHRGLRKQKQTIFCDGYSDRRIFFPAEDTPIASEYAVKMAEQYEKKYLRQIRFLLKLQIYYLVSFCTQKHSKITPQ